MTKLMTAQLAALVLFAGNTALGQDATDAEAVEAVHDAYHAAFGKEDMELMSDLWAHDQAVRLIVPPGEKVFAGWDEVKKSFERAFEFLDVVALHSKDAQTIVGSDIAWAVDVHELEMHSEDGQLIKPVFFSTHVYHKADGRWLMVHHQASAPPPAEE